MQWLHGRQINEANRILGYHALVAANEIWEPVRNTPKPQYETAAHEQRQHERGIQGETPRLRCNSYSCRHVHPASPSSSAKRRRALAATCVLPRQSFKNPR